MHHSFRTHTAFVHAALDLGGPEVALEAIKGMRRDGFVPNLALYNKARHAYLCYWNTPHEMLYAIRNH